MSSSPLLVFVLFLSCVVSHSPPPPPPPRLAPRERFRCRQLSCLFILWLITLMAITFVVHDKCRVPKVFVAHTHCRSSVHTRRRFWPQKSCGIFFSAAELSRFVAQLMANCCGVPMFRAYLSSWQYNRLYTMAAGCTAPKIVALLLDNLTSRQKQNPSHATSSA